jgi:hypothetical protein
MFNGAGVPLKCNNGGDGFTWIILSVKTPASARARYVVRPLKVPQPVLEVDFFRP